MSTANGRCKWTEWSWTKMDGMDKNGLDGRNGLDGHRATSISSIQSIKTQNSG